jgi:hypothetical protein
MTTSKQGQTTFILDLVSAEENRGLSLIRS